MILPVAAQPNRAGGVARARARALACALSFAASFAPLALGCNVRDPPRGPEQVCADACASRAERCSRAECSRGCNLVLDRLVEHEGGHVIACVARGRGACDDRAWARCATRVGPHADGGPPAPPPPSDVFDEPDPE